MQIDDYNKTCLYSALTQMQMQMQDEPYFDYAWVHVWAYWLQLNYPMFSDINMRVSMLN